MFCSSPGGDEEDAGVCCLGSASPNFFFLTAEEHFPTLESRDCTVNSNKHWGELM